MSAIYLDAAYVAKCYVNEPDSAAVRKLAWAAERRCSSAWSMVEVACVFHRQVREGALTDVGAAMLREVFLDDVAARVWLLLPVSDTLMHRVSAAVRNLPPEVALRAGDAVHLVSARDAGFLEIWTNDRRLLRAARHFGLAGKRVTA